MNPGDRPEISLEIPESVFENQGSTPYKCSIKVKNAPNQDMILNIWSYSVNGMQEDILHPIIVSVPAGQTSADFDITVVDNDSKNNDRTITLKAVGYGWESVESTLTVIDDEAMEEESADDSDSSCFIKSSI